MKKRRSKRITKNALKKFVLAEAKKLQKEALNGKVEDVSKVKAEEYEAGEEAGTIESDIDFMKALKIKEVRLMERVKAIRNTRKKLRQKILRSI